MCGLTRRRWARIPAVGRAFVQNLGYGHDAIATDVPDHERFRMAFNELAVTV